ncbi:dienelactone hydrolase family protein [Aliihoeflea sp. PC F10.4]
MKSRTIVASASDGHELSAYLAEPDSSPRGGVLVFQEIFGVNSHIRAVTDRLAAEGYVAIAPQLFDRLSPDFESGYSADEITAARPLLARFDWDAALLDAEAARAAIAGQTGKVSALGFCLGGSLAFLCATRMSGISSAIVYYGGQIALRAAEVPGCPVLMHFGEMDHTIPIVDVETIRRKRPESEIHVYPSGHGFNCDERASFEPKSAALAWSRTLDWLDRNGVH